MTDNRVRLECFRGKRVLLTGDTGFKGSWLALWLVELGAKVTGAALPPTRTNDLFVAADVAKRIRHIDLDITDLAACEQILKETRPDIVFHLAAQSLVGLGYLDPVTTYQTNVIGTLNIMLAASKLETRPKIVNVTSDKCYRNDGCGKPYVETDELGGKDPYSNSKACAELVAKSVRHSFYSDVDVASVRAGNVIGGGDWCEDRLVPDLFRALFTEQSMVLRNPAFVRPWQFVLEPLYGYLLVGAHLISGDQEAAQAWNFGPESSNMRSAGSLIESFVGYLGSRACPVINGDSHIASEATVLRLDSSKAREKLGWRPLLTFDEMIAWTTEGYFSLAAGSGAMSIVQQLHQFMDKAAK